MKISSKVAAASGLAVAFFALAPTASNAEEPLPSAQPTITPETDPQRFDREGKLIVGYELMSDTERSGYRALLFAIKDPVAREQARAAHRQAMETRAAERGVKLQE